MESNETSGIPDTESHTTRFILRCSVFTQSKTVFATDATQPQEWATPFIGNINEFILFTTFLFSVEADNEIRNRESYRFQTDMNPLRSHRSWKIWDHDRGTILLEHWVNKLSCFMFQWWFEDQLIGMSWWFQCCRSIRCWNIACGIEQSASSLQLAGEWRQGCL